MRKSKPRSREEIEAELKRRGWRYVSAPAMRFIDGRWKPVKSGGLWFRPAARQAELLGASTGLLFVNAAIEEGLDPENCMAVMHSRYMPATVSGGWENGIKRQPGGGFLVDLDKRSEYIKRKAKK